jgi:hydrogenase expression/formation protein HypE
MLGFDALYVANEGKLIAIVENKYANKVLAAMKSHPLGADAVIIGTVTERPDTHVMLKTTFGTTRIIDMMSGEMLPRIC